MTQANELMGVVRADGSLELAGKLTLPAGRVRVRVESVEGPPSETIGDFLDRTHGELVAAGHEFMTDEEVAAWVRDQRGEDDSDRIEEAYRRLEEANRKGEDPC